MELQGTTWKEKLTGWTFGFELEGGFLNNTIIRAKKDMQKMCSVGGIYEHGDGSVRVSQDSTARALGVSVDEVSEARELSVGVFSNIDDMLNILSLFKNGKTYHRDESCGLHVHAKPPEALSIAMKSWKFVDTLQKYTRLAGCEHIRDRLRNNSYCEPYRRDDVFHDIERGQKYRFMRNHPQGTLEFRIFSTCEHKSENVEKLLRKAVDIIEGMKPEVEERLSVIAYKITSNIKTNVRNNRNISDSWLEF